MFDPGDDVALARAVEKVAEDPELRAHLLRRGFATAEHFDIERTADAFERWHLAAAEGRLADMAAQ
jgi:glycosyltransferase involved in cell wall biosynthesis